jgi:hypothetical protein
LKGEKSRGRQLVGIEGPKVGLMIVKFHAGRAGQQAGTEKKGKG